MNLVENLQKVYDFLDSHNWTQKTYARDKEGEPCPINSDEADSFCCIGAIRRAVPNRTEAEDVQDTLLGYTRFITKFNDADGRTKEEVLEFIQEVIDAEST